MDLHAVEHQVGTGEKAQVKCAFSTHSALCAGGFTVATSAKNWWRGWNVHRRCRREQNSLLFQDDRAKAEATDPVICISPQAAVNS